jgi:predicted ATPase
MQGEVALRMMDGHQSGSDTEIEAEERFRTSLDIARAQDAKAYELRAATRLARLWRDQNKRSEARDLLAPVYAWFTEGFDTRDPIEAKGLLDEL